MVIKTVFFNEIEIVKNMKLIYLAATVLFLTLLSCQSNSKKLLEREDYSISYKQDYEIEESGINGVDFYIALSHDKDHNFTNNINLLVQDLSETGLDLKKFVDLTESQIKSSGQLITSERKNRNGAEYQSIVFEANFGKGDLKFLQYDFVQDNKAYVLTYTATLSTFDQDLSKAQEVMDSFLLR